MNKKKNISDLDHHKLFKVPDQYFESLTQEIQNKVQPAKSNVWVVISSGLTLASLVVVFFVFQPTSESDSNLLSFTAEEAYDYLVLNDDFLIEDYLTDAIVANDVSINANAFYDIPQGKYINTHVLDGISIDYLDLEDYDYED